MTKKVLKKYKSPDSAVFFTLEGRDKNVYNNGEKR